MIKNIILKSCSTLIYFSMFLLFTLVAFSDSKAQYACLPTCDTDDGQFLALAAMGLSTSNNRDAEYQIISAPTRQTFEIGIFDGDGSGTSWDINNEPFVVLHFFLYADPEGDGTGDEILIDRWSSDGNFGSNIGDPMPNDDWFVRILPNVEEARTPDGNFSYRLLAQNINPNVLGLNGYKVRSDGVIAIPAEAAFNYTSSPRDPKDFETLYPNIDLEDPACVSMERPGFFCNPIEDPSCCLNPTLYTGEWSFCFVVPDNIDTLNIWDGDFDFGSASFDSDGNCIKPDNAALDTDDPNTPVPIPEWALNTDVITQGASIPTEPADDNGCFPAGLRPPSVNYVLKGPNGETYMNDNPSGNVEWELFNISTQPFNPNLYDIHVDNIEPGTWCVMTIGNDMQNLNALRLPYAVVGVDDEGTPVVGPPSPPAVPVFNRWGLVSMIILLTGAAVYYLRKKSFIG